MREVKEIKIEDLIFEGSGELLHTTFESIREGLGLTKDKFIELLESEKGQEIYETYDEVLADILTAKFSNGRFREQLAISRQNEQAIIKENQALLQSYFAYVHAVYIVYHRLIDAAFKKRKRYRIDIRDMVNISLYGNLCRKADEIGLMLKNGLPDAALVLWRTFYEYGVVACFMMKHDSETLALQFADAGNRDVFKKAASFDQRASNLKFKPLHKKVRDEINSEFMSLQSKYPKEFFTNDYGWAFGFIEGKINFRNLEEAADFSRYRPFYIWASEKSHPNFHGITDYRNNKKQLILQKIVRQDIEKQAMIDPAQLTLAVFDQVNQHFITKYSVEHEIKTNFKLFRRLYERFAASL